MFFLLVCFKIFIIKSKREKETPSVLFHAPARWGCSVPAQLQGVSASSQCGPGYVPSSTPASSAELFLDRYLTFSVHPPRPWPSRLEKAQKRTGPRGGRETGAAGPDDRAAGPAEGPRGPAGEDRAGRVPEAWGKGENRLHFPGTGTRRSRGVPQRGSPKSLEAVRTMKDGESGEGSRAPSQMADASQGHAPTPPGLQTDF